MQDGRLKSFCLLYLLEEPEVQLGLFFQALCGRRFLTLKIFQSLGQGQDIAEEKQSMKSKCRGALREGDTGGR